MRRLSSLNDLCGWSGSDDSDEEIISSEKGRRIKGKAKLFDAIMKFEEQAAPLIPLRRRSLSIRRSSQIVRPPPRRFSLYEGGSGPQWLSRTEAYGRCDILLLQNSERKKLQERWGGTLGEEQQKPEEEAEYMEGLVQTWRQSRASIRRASIALVDDMPKSERQNRRLLVMEEADCRQHITTMLGKCLSVTGEAESWRLRFLALVKREVINRGKILQLQVLQRADMVSIESGNRACIAMNWTKPIVAKKPPSSHRTPRTMISFPGCPFKERHNCVFFASPHFDVTPQHLNLSARGTYSALRLLSPPDCLPAALQ